MRTVNGCSVRGYHDACGGYYEKCGKLFRTTGVAMMHVGEYYDNSTRCSLQ